jgi:drug/metabolite transporter (DMT)-like permease
VTARGRLLFATMAVIWGVPYLFIKVAVEDFSPAAVVFGRTALAALLLLPIAAARGMLRPLLPRWPWLLAFAACEVAGPFLLLTYAEQRISSSLTGLLVAAVPLLGLMFGRLMGLSDPIDARRLLGLIVGVLGVAVLVGVDLHADSWTAAVAVLFAAAGYAIGPILANQRLAALPSLGVSAVAMGVTAVAYLPFAVLTRPADLASALASSWWAIAVLGIVCSALAFLLFFALIAEVGPTRATVITYVNPAVALLLGVLVLSEPLTLGLLVGFPLVLLGSALATRRVPAPPVGSSRETAEVRVTQ